MGSGNAAYVAEALVKMRQGVNEWTGPSNHTAAIKMVISQSASMMDRLHALIKMVYRF